MVKFDGKVSCWGSNNLGQLGVNSTAHSDYPVDVRDHTGNTDTTLENIIQVSAGDEYTCAVNSAGEVLCWGTGRYGQLGNNSKRNDQHYPRFVNGINNSGRLNGVIQVSTGYAHTCALEENGRVSCWGANGHYQLGRPYQNYRESYHPRYVRASQNGPPLEGIVRVIVGALHTCATTSEKKILCWGASQYGRLGNGTLGHSQSHSNYPVAVRDSSGTAGSTLSDVTQISAGSRNTCALKINGTAYCWGYGALGISQSDPSSSHPLLLDLSNVKAITQPSSNSSHETTCALDSYGKAKCWGNNRAGQLAFGSPRAGSDVDPISRTLPMTIRAHSSNNSGLDGIVDIRPGGKNSCSLMTSGKVKCWGLNSHIGIGGGGYSLYPVNVHSSSSNPSFTPGVNSYHYVLSQKLPAGVLSAPYPFLLGEGGPTTSSAMPPQLSVSFNLGMERISRSIPTPPAHQHLWAVQ